MWSISDAGRGESIQKLTSDFHIWSELNNITPLELHDHLVKSEVPWPPANTSLHSSSTYSLLHLDTVTWYVYFTFRSTANQQICQYSLFHWMREMFPPTPGRESCTNRLANMASGAHSWSSSNDRKCGFAKSELWSHRHNRNPLSRGTGQTWC